MKRKNIFNWLDTKFYLAIIAIMTIIIGIFQPVVGMISALVFFYLIYYNITETNKKNKEIDKHIEGLKEDFESAAKHAIFNMPFPLVIIDNKGTITWYNTPFLDMIIEDDVLNQRIYDLVPKFNMDKLLEEKKDKSIEIRYNDKNYVVHINFVENKKTSIKRDDIIMIYWVDNTEHVNLKNLYRAEQTIISLIYIDNYDDIKNNTPDVNRPLLLAEIDRNINEYFSNYNAVVRKYENDKYMVIMDHDTLEKLQERKLDILDNIRELNMGNTIPITLSMGVSATGHDLLKSYDHARSAIDIALGRGGDQAVLNKNGTFEYYGGKSKAVEKRNKVRARVIADALRQLIEQSSNVFIMGHTNPDMDSFGSAIGLLGGIEGINKQGYIVLNEVNPSIRNIYEELKREEPELLKRVVDSEKARETIDENSLMILVDNHKPSFTEDPELLELVNKVVVIDHHRRGAEFVKDPVLTYLESYASSASELVTEILTYMDDDINLSKFEAEALLAGITVDTKNFSFQTGVRTFEAASVLKRAGADTIKVRQLFRDELDTIVYKAEIMKSAKIIFDKIAIGKLERKSNDGTLIAAQAANELLDINGVEASFVLTDDDERVHISGRSLGSISVQIILEKLGGGGHLTIAGAQLMGVTLEKAEEKLKKAIDDYLKEGEE